VCRPLRLGDIVTVIRGRRPNPDLQPVAGWWPGLPAYEFGLIIDGIAAGEGMALAEITRGTVSDEFLIDGKSGAKAFTTGHSGGSHQGSDACFAARQVGAALFLRSSQKSRGSISISRPEMDQHDRDRRVCTRTSDGDPERRLSALSAAGPRRGRRLPPARYGFRGAGRPGCIRCASSLYWPGELHPLAKRAADRSRWAYEILRRGLFVKPHPGR